MTPTGSWTFTKGTTFTSRTRNPSAQSVIYYPSGSAKSDSQGLVKYLNAMPAVTGRKTQRFSLVTKPVSGSLSRKVGQDLGIPAATFETCLKDPLERRVGFQLYAVKYIASRMGMTLGK